LELVKHFFSFRSEEGNFEERAFLDEASPEDGPDPESFGKIKDLGICQVLESLEAVTDDLIKR
jgi:hypothetical protein